MNYNKLYTRFIESRPLRIKKRNDGFETHHILPKSLGGKHIKKNIIVLTPKEHYIAHLLLSKFTKGEDRMKMVNAVRRMAGKSARSYEVFRKGWMRLVSKQSKDRWADPKFRKKMILIHKNRNHNLLREARKARWSKPNASDEFKFWWKKNKKRMSQTYKKSWTEDRRRARSEAMKQIWSNPSYRKNQTKIQTLRWSERKSTTEVF